MKERVNSINRILEEREADFRVEYKKIWHNNAEKEAYILISKKANCTPVMYKDVWTDKPNEEIVDYLCLAYSEYALVLNTQGFSNAEELKGRILPRVSSVDNMDALKRADIFFLEDIIDGLVVSFYFPVTLSSQDQSGCVQLTNVLMSTLALTQDEVYEAAISNMAETIRIVSVEDLLAEMFGVKLDDDPSDPPALTVVTNKDRQLGLGAAAILCPELYEMLRARIGSDDLIVLPSSIHEVLVTPADTESDISAYKEMVREVNDTQVAPEDRLSYSVFGWRGGVLQALA